MIPTTRACTTGQLVFCFIVMVVFSALSAGCGDDSEASAPNTDAVDDGNAARDVSGESDADSDARVDTDTDRDDLDASIDDGDQNPDVPPDIPADVGVDTSADTVRDTGTDDTGTDETGTEDAGTSDSDSGAFDTSLSDTESDSSVDGDDTDAVISDDLAGLSDDFEDTDGHAGWVVFNSDAASVTEADGVLRIAASANSVWLNSDTATLVHRTLSGNFQMTALLAAESDGGPPDGNWEYAGIMMRLADPAADSTAGEDYVFIALGHNTTTNGVEGKVTDDGDSDWNQRDVSAAAGSPFTRELRLCRIGSSIRGFYRELGEDWTELVLNGRPPDDGVQYFPPTDRADFADHPLNVGMFAYANNGGDADLVAEFDYVVFERVSSCD